MWPPIESDSPKQFLGFLGIPEIVWWGILSGCLIVFSILVFLTFLFCWFLPQRRQKKLDLLQNITVTPCHNTGSSQGELRTIIHLDKIFCKNIDIVRFVYQIINKLITKTAVTKSFSVSDSVQPSSSLINRQQHMLNYQQFPSSSSCGVNMYCSNTSEDCLFQNIPETHKSMWVLNPLYTSTSGKNN